MLLGDRPGAASPEATEFLHLAAVASLTEVAVEEAKEEVEQNLRGSFLEELRAKPDELDPHEVVRRAARLGCDLARGAIVLCAELSTDRPRHVVATIAGEHPGALAQHMELPGDAPRVYALLPAAGGDEAPEATLVAARRLAARLQRHGTVGLSSFYADPAELGRAIQEAELVLDVLRRSDVPISEDIGTGTYRLLFRVLASHPEEVRSFYDDTVAPIVKYDDQYATDLVGTLESYLEQNCNMNATAAAIYAHRHTVAYRLDRVKELTGPRPDAVRGPRAAGPRTQGLSHHRAAPPALKIGYTPAMRLTRLMAGLAVTAAALACAAAPARAAETGVNETLGQTVHTAQTAQRLGADWVRLWTSWEILQPGPGAFVQHHVDQLNARVADLKARGIKVLVVVHQSPRWASGAGGTAPPSDPATFGRFMGALAARVPGADAWELWNEPNSTGFFAGAPDPARYAGMLRAAYPAIKAAQPSDAVVTGGLNGNDTDFVAALYANGAQGAFDAIGVHTDTACLLDHPDRYYRDAQGRIARFTFTGYREIHQLMADHGDGAKPIWMTEIGWNTQSTKPRSCNVGDSAGKKRLGVSRKQQARFLRAAYRCIAADPYIGVALWFGMQDIPRNLTRHAAGFGLYGRNGKAKPAAKQFRRLDKGYPPARRLRRLRRPHAAHHQGAVAARRRPLLRQDLVRVRASDNQGGSGIGRISLALDGEHIRSWGGNGGSIAPWWGSADWSPGAHTLTFSVKDFANNATAATVTVTKTRR